HKTAAEYGRLAAETARVMRRADTRIELVACGSSGSAMPTFGSWESTVLEHTYDLVDYISLHSYYDREASDLDTYLASSLDMEAFIENVTAICDAVGARARSRRRVHLAFDEWNAWYQSRYRQQPDVPWMEAPRLIEDTYDQVDAVVVG